MWLNEGDGRLNEGDGWLHSVQRFYLRNSVMDYHPKEILVTAVYLATKVEEFNVSIRKTSFLSPHSLYFILLHIRNQCC